MSDGSFEGLMLLLWGLVVAVGVPIVWLAARAGRRGGSPPLYALAAGLCLVGVGSPSFWMVGYLLTDNLELCSAGTAALTFAGFGLLLYSIRARDRGPVAAG